MRWNYIKNYHVKHVIMVTYNFVHPYLNYFAINSFALKVDIKHSTDQQDKYLCRWFLLDPEYFQKNTHK